MKLSCYNKSEPSCILIAWGLGYGMVPYGRQVHVYSEYGQGPYHSSVPSIAVSWNISSYGLLSVRRILIKDMCPETE